MSLLRAETRDITMSDIPWSAGGSRSMTYDPSALRLIPLYSATTGIADDVAVMPWHAYTQKPEGWGEQLGRQPKILTDPTGQGVGLIPWLNQGVMSALLWGYAFGIVLTIGADGWPEVVRWVHPSRATIDETGTRVRFLVDGQEIDPMTVVYVPGPVLPGSIRGLSPISLFRLQFSKSMAAQRYAWQAFDQGIMPPGVLRNTARTMDTKDLDTAKARFKASVEGRDIFATGKDWEWTALGVPDDDARFLETIKAGATEIAAIYRVTPEDVGGETGSSLTYSTLAENQHNRNRRSLLPWVRRFEWALTAARPRPQYVKANMDALIRTDIKSRMEAHEIALRTGLETNAEGRALEDKAPLTPEQVTEWQTFYGARKAAPVTTTAGGQ